LKKLFLLFFIHIFVAKTFCQQKYRQQRTDYKIAVTLNDDDNTLSGYEIIDYYNNAPDTLKFIWIHIWPNAYKNDRTAFSDQLLQNGRTDFYFSDEDKRGYINRLAFKVDKQNATTEDHPQHQDIIKLILPHAIAPGEKIKIETPFHVKLPYNFSRGGHIDKSYQLTQWYPKPAVFDKTGWHEMPYLDQGEFYSEFGSFDVDITLPKKYIVAATGNLKNETADGELKTMSFNENNVHDFAWFADKNFIEEKDTMQLGNRSINVKVYHFADEKNFWKDAVNYTKNAVRTRSEWVGEYPYDNVSVVENSAATGGGMEYPTITLLNAGGSSGALESVIEHEVGHNWFYGILATNERDFPWMDEGMNTFYDRRFDAAAKGQKNRNMFLPENSFINKRLPEHSEQIILETATGAKRDQPINTVAQKFSALNSNIIAYTKTAEWLKLIEDKVGMQIFDKIMQTYYTRWKFKHPYPEDFKAVAEEVSGLDMGKEFALLNAKGSLVQPKRKSVKITSFFNLKETDKYTYLSVAPALGINFYDKLMIGGVVHNYNLPPNHFQFFIAPLYATGTKKINGIGRMEYNFYPGNAGAKATLSLAGAKFTGDSFTDSNGAKSPLPFYKIVPSARYLFANKDPRSRVKKFVQFKTFLINETGISFKTDVVTGADVITYPKVSRYINQLQFVFENNRVLYPYNAAVQTEQGDGFVRSNFTGNYFFNYAKGGGLNVRLFAAKFFYTFDKTFFNHF
jgi:hypothetical protein